MTSTLPVIERTVAESKPAVETAEAAAGGMPLWLLIMIIVVGLSLIHI